MDISAVVVVLILIVLFLGAVVWIEVQSRQTGSKVSLKDGKTLESQETDLEQDSPFFPLLSESNRFE